MPQLKQPVIDLHADVLSYLADGKTRTIFDSACHASAPQLLEGGVCLQVLPIFTMTGNAALTYASAQAQAFEHLTKHSELIFPIRSKKDLMELPKNNKIGVIAAIENASGFCADGEPLSDGLDRLDKIIQQVGPLLYVSLTWNGENRFGGGTGSAVGLTADGRVLLEILAKRSIAVDLSHASDPLAHDILTIARSDPKRLRVMASHSNFRAICEVPRNLSDTIAKEIFELKGIIGCNAVEKFLGSEAIDNLAKHLAHGMSLGGSAGLSFGADFFCEDDIPKEHRIPSDFPMFAPYWSDASRYPTLLSRLTLEFGFTAEQINALAFKNALKMIMQMLSSSNPRGFLQSARG